MAGEEDKTIIHDGKGAPPAAGETKSKGGMNKMILFGGIGVGAVMIGLVLAIFVIKPMMSGSGGSEETATAEVKPADESEKATKEEKPKKSSKSGEPMEVLIYSVDNIVVNPAGTGGSRFLSVSFGFELESKELETEFTKKEAIIRDALITIMSSKTVAQLTDAKQKEIARYQIKQRVCQLMGTEEIAGVYYTDFVLQ